MSTDSLDFIQVAYVSSPIMRVNVRAVITGQEGLVTNDFTIAFKQQRGQVTPVVPETIPDAWLYIHAYRQHLLEEVGDNLSFSQQASVLTLLNLLKSDDS